MTMALAVEASEEKEEAPKEAAAKADPTKFTSRKVRF